MTSRIVPCGAFESNSAIIVLASAFENDFLLYLSICVRRVLKKLNNFAMTFDYTLFYSFKINAEDPDLLCHTTLQRSASAARFPLQGLKTLSMK